MLENQQATKKEQYNLNKLDAGSQLSDFKVFSLFFSKIQSHIYYNMQQ